MVGLVGLVAVVVVVGLEVVEGLEVVADMVAMELEEVVSGEGLVVEVVLVERLGAKVGLVVAGLEVVADMVVVLGEVAEEE
jgi:hypothetical protein